MGHLNGSVAVLVAKGENVKRICLVLLLFLVPISGCEETASPPTRAASVVQDSAGVRVVYLPGEISAYATPELKAERLIRIGEDGSGLDLFRVSAARFLPSGILVIANAGVPELLLVDTTGHLVRRVGDRGEGPGQFGTITSLHIQDDGSIVTFDDRLARLTEFDPSGEVLSTRRMTDPNPVSDLIPLAASQSGPVLAIYGDKRTFGQGGVRQDSTPLLRFSPESPLPDSLAHWPTKSWQFVPVGGGMSRTQVPFSPDLLSAGGDQRAALATTHEPIISVFDEIGTLIMSVRWDEESREVSEADFEEWRQERLSALPDAIPEGDRQQLVDIEHHPTHPLLMQIFLDAEGAVWFASAALSSDSNRTWIRINAGGEPEGAIVLPSSARIMDASHGRIVVLDRDELDVELISVFEFDEEEGAGLSNAP